MPITYCHLNSRRGPHEPLWGKPIQDCRHALSSLSETLSLLLQGVMGITTTTTNQTSLPFPPEVWKQEAGFWAWGIPLKTPVEDQLQALVCTRVRHGRASRLVGELGSRRQTGEQWVGRRRKDLRFSVALTGCQSFFNLTPIIKQI